MKAKDGDKFYSHVILRQKNPKTQEVSQLPPFKLPPEHKALALQPSALEARHFAAAYALYRVSSMKNIHMTMPPQFRDLWKNQFADIKKDDIAHGKDWMYADDPFRAQRDREAAQAAKAKKFEIRAKEQTAREKEYGPGISLAKSSGTSIGKDFMKGWKTAPKVEMGKRVRREVESIIRNQASWNPADLTLSSHERSRLIDEVAMLGFRRSHVEEAAAICKDREEVLEWLLIHVPEDDLPKWSLPENYLAGVSMASGNLSKDAAIKRLASTGYAADLCEEAFDQSQNDEYKAAVRLQNQLLGSSKPSDPRTDDDPSDMTIWIEEQAVLSSIFEKRYKKLDQRSCQIRLEIVHESVPIEILLKAPERYPADLPIILVLAANLPSYIKLSILRKALQYLQDSCMGDQMIFNLVDWLEHEIPMIIETPGKLQDVASVANASAPTNLANEVSRIRRKRKRHPLPLKTIPGSPMSQRILQEWEHRQQTPAQQAMLKGRQKLPAWQLQEAIAEAVRTHQVVIVSGETGSGKSTQSVQFVLDDVIKRQLGDAANIICTQPRRISALGLADRVADERCSAVGDEVGYIIRGESKVGPGTRLTFVTTGVLLRRLQTSGGSPKDVVNSLADVSHIVVDEVHERSLDTDFLLALLRDVLRHRKDLKLILMSATLDADVFERYFGGPAKVAKLEVQGRTFPVTDHYLDDIVAMTNFRVPDLSKFAESTYEESDLQEQTEKKDTSIGKQIQQLGMGTNYDLIASLVRSIDAHLGSQDGGILIFLPGTMEISRALDALRSIPNIHALPLHASLLPVEQRRVFHPPPYGKRKVIASTNVAETSITISDIVAVIDSGRVKETRFDPQNQMVKLEDVWTSKAAGKQRRGRAGRVRAGDCYKLYTRSAEVKMADRPEPEIRRTPLEQLCLSVKAMGVQDVSAFLANTLTPPEAPAVEGALSLLSQMGAIDDDALTSLGQHMAIIPADLRCAKLMVYGALFGCLEPCLTIASILTVRSPFVSPKDKREQSKSSRLSFGGDQGDVVADLNAYNAWTEQRGGRFVEVRAWCDERFLSNQTLNDISTTRGQYISSLKEIGFLPHSYGRDTQHESLNANQTSSALLHALILGSLYPQVVRIQLPSTKYAATSTGTMAVDPEAREIRFFSASSGPDARVFIHPSSSLFSAQTFFNNAPFMSYFQRVMTSKPFIREMTPCSTFGMLLFGGRRVALDSAGRGLVIGGSGDEEHEWRIRGWARIGVLIGRLRSVLDAVLGRWIEEPAASTTEQERALVNVVRKLVEKEGLDN